MTSITAYWVNPEEQGSLVDSGSVLDEFEQEGARDVLAVGYNASFVIHGYGQGLVFYRASTVGKYYPLRLGNRNDGHGTFEKHSRINTTGWQQWSSNLGNRIGDGNRGSYQ